MTKIVRVDLDNPSVNIIKEMVQIIKNGGVVVYPTDTVYGLGANALNPRAVLKIFKIKKRSLNQPLPVIVSGLKMAEKLAFINNDARKLIGAFWPGSLTIIMDKKPVLPSIVVSGGSSVGLRMPNHTIPLMMLKTSKLPLVATSANIHGKPDPIDAKDIIKQIGKEVDLIFDCGKTKGKPSTIVDLTKVPPLIVRSGSINREAIEKVIGPVES